MKLYIASSWRNTYQPNVAVALRYAGHEVYDFRNPPNKTGFAWSQIDRGWQSWSRAAYREALADPIAIDGFTSDFSAMEWSDACVLVLPCGRSAHLEAGYMAGQGKPVVVYMPEPCEPELMYLLLGSFGNIALTLDEVSAYLSSFRVHA